MSYQNMNIYRTAFQLTVHIEQCVREFRKCDKYTTGSELRKMTTELLYKVATFNDLSKEEKYQFCFDLRQGLKLKKAVKLAPLSCGINFLGYVQHTFYRLPRRRVLNNIRIGLKKWSKINESKELDFEDLKNLRSSLNSYLAYTAKAKAFKAMKEIFRPHGWIWKFFELRGEKVVLRTEFIEAEKRAKFERIFNGKSFDFILEF